ncbi:hypothetical protein [Shigella sonnei]|uniref:hypothetical protein n=1 Tax=Shigella sonnei TaxID=624 RepID=UPI001493AED9|nr:hypothetical protein [Shigella sonnei]
MYQSVQDGICCCWVLHQTMPDNHGEQVPASTLQTVPAKVPDLTPISGYQRPTRPGDITPRIMDDWGQ